METINLPVAMLIDDRFMPDDVGDWLDEHCRGDIGQRTWWYEPHYVDRFNQFSLHLPDNDTAILFKLTWCGEYVC